MVISKLSSRKFWIGVIAAIFSMVALLGYDVPIEEVVVIDAIMAIYILAEAIVDCFRKEKA